MAVCEEEVGAAEGEGESSGMKNAEACVTCRLSSGCFDRVLLWHFKRRFIRNERNVFRVDAAGFFCDDVKAECSCNSSDPAGQGKGSNRSGTKENVIDEVVLARQGEVEIQMEERGKHYANWKSETCCPAQRER